MGFTDFLKTTIRGFTGGAKRKTEEEPLEQSPAKKAKAAGRPQQQGMPNAHNGHAFQHRSEDPADHEAVGHTSGAAAPGQQLAGLSQQQQQQTLRQLPAHKGGSQQHLQQQDVQHPASAQLFGSLPGFSSAAGARGYEQVRNTLAQPPTATLQQRAAYGAHHRPARRMPMVSQQALAGGGRGPAAPTPMRQWFGDHADGSGQSPATFRISPVTGPERPRSRQPGSYGTMGPPPQQHHQQQQLLLQRQQQQQRRPYGGRHAAEVQRTSRPMQAYGATSAAAGAWGVGAAAGAAAAAGRGRSLLAAPAGREAAGAAAAAEGVWRRSASPPLQQVAQRLFGADIAEEPGHTAAAAAAAARRTALPGSGAAAAAAAAGGAGPSGAAAAAPAAAGGVLGGVVPSQLTPPPRFNAALPTIMAELGADPAAVVRDAALDQREAAALARTARAEAEFDKAKHRSKEAKKHSQQVIQRIDSHLLAQLSPDYKANPASHEAMQQLQEKAIQHNLQRQLQEQQRLQEMQQQRQQAAERIAKQHAAAAAALPRLPAMPAWQRRPPQQQQQQEEAAGDDDEVVIVSSDEEEAGSNQEQYPDEAEGSGSGEEASEYESEEEAESEEAEAAAAELGALGISAWLAPRANWRCTQEQMSRYTAATQGPGRSDEVLVAHARSNLELTRHDLSTMRPNEWLNDECINMYMALLQDRDAALRSSGGLSCHFFNTFFLNKLYRDADAYNYKNVRRWTLPARLKSAGLSVDCVLKCDRVIIPVHEGSHWTALMVDVKAQRIVFFDSYAGENRRAVGEVKRWVCDEAKDKLKVDWDMSGWQEVYPKDIPRQTNSVDCGVFALMFCNRMGLRGGAYDFREEDVSVNVRAAITHDLLEGKIQLSGKRS